LNQKFHYVAIALKDLPDETVIDGELVALGPDGRPDFNLLQNFRSAESRIVYYAFDILIHERRNLIQLPLSERRAILSGVIEPGEHVALSEVSDRSAAEMLAFIKGHGLEGAVAKRSDSVDQPGQRTGLWSKYRINLGHGMAADNAPKIQGSCAPAFISHRCLLMIASTAVLASPPAIPINVVSASRPGEYRNKKRMSFIHVRCV
jgi:hypothetical protein